MFMKHNRLLFLSLFLITVIADASAQRLPEKRLKEMEKMMKEKKLLQPDADFETGILDNKYTSESAVLMAHKTTFDFDTRKKNKVLKAFITIRTLGIVNAMNEKDLLVEERERRKILLQDNFAVDKYSIIYFRLDEEEDLFEARVIKKDGSISSVSLEDAIKVTSYSEVPKDFVGYTDNPPSRRYRPEFYKVPIPDLETGDQIEYAFQHVNSQHYVTGIFSDDDFNPVYYLCEREMPVIKQVIEVTTVSDYSMGYRSLKGAAGFEESEENGKRKYRWTDVNRPGIRSLAYMNPITTLPSVKFQVIYAKKRGQEFIWFNNNGATSKPLSMDEFATKGLKYWNRIDQFEDDRHGNITFSTSRSYSVLNKQMKKLGITELPDDEFVKTSYYFLRGKTLWQEWTDYEFAKSFSTFLSKRSIPHDVVITTNHKISSVSDIAFEEEIVWGIRAKGQYYFNPGDHLNPGEIPSYVSGNPCGIFKIEKLKAIGAHEVQVLPASDTSQNRNSVTITATPDIIKATVKIQKETEAMGVSKELILDDILAETPFAETDLRNYGGVGLWEQLPISEQEKLIEEWEFLKKKWKEEKPQTMKLQASYSYGRPVVQYTQFRLLQDGRNHKKSVLKYNEQFELGEMIATVGDDLVLDIPLLIEQQKQVKQEDRVRIRDIDVGFARTNSWKINCIIPPGYQVVETENLKQEVKNAAGKFSTNFQINGNILTILVVKQYAQRLLPVQQWNQMIAFLDTAYSFSISKIVMKKVK
jgi:hypothetical protein